MAETFHSSGFKLTSYMMPIYRTDPNFISEWRLGDNTSGSGLDSHHLNHLIASGSPVNTPGWKFASGTLFDGVNDAFYIAYNTSSGIEPLLPGFTTTPANVHNYAQWGITANIRCDDFSRDQVLFSRWDGAGDDRMFLIGLSTTSGIFFKYRQDSTSTIGVGYGRDNLIPSGFWFNFGFGYSARDNGNSIYYVRINDALFVKQLSDMAANMEDSTSGIFCIGAANLANAPSGHFKGAMENVLFFNGKGWTQEEFEYIASGNTPITTRPSVNIYHPHLKGVWHLDAINSGIQGQNNGLYAEEKISAQHLWTSGTGSGYITVAPGAADGTKGSGFLFPPHDPLPLAKLARHVSEISTNTILPFGSFTITSWLRPYIAQSNDLALYGGDAVDSTFPFSTRLASMAPNIRIAADDLANVENATTTTKLIANNWSHIAYKVDFARARISIFTSGVEQVGSQMPMRTSGLWALQKIPTTQFYSIRRTAEPSTESYSGIIDEVLFFRDALTSGEINNFYTASSGFIPEFTSVSGKVGGYIEGLQYALVGGYLSGLQGFASGLTGGWLAGVDGSGIASFYGYYDIIGRYFKDFDALASIYKTHNSSFDAQATLFTQEIKPDALIILPTTNQSGNITPKTYNFEATASGYNNKRILYTQWFFSDVPGTSGSRISSSGTYQTSHTFGKSGIFDVIFIAVDEQGLINSDRRIISTVSGITTATISLTSTVSSGVTPLSVGFSGIINTAPNPIIDKFIYFGDGTYSVSTQNILKKYVVPGIYIPVFRVLDNQGIICTDSLIIGTNN